MRSRFFGVALLTLLIFIGYSAAWSLPATANNLNAVTILSASSGWAVGNSGITLHFDGGGWTPIPSATPSDLFGVSFGSPATPYPTGFAVGGSSALATALYWGTVGWSNASVGLSSPNAKQLSSVFEVSPSDAWAVDGVTGAFWHWSGTAGLGGGWNMITLGGAGLNSVFMTSATDGWAVGAGGTIYHYTGGGWTVFTTTGITLNSVFMLSSTEGWAVGNGGSIFHYSSGIWTGPVSPGSTSADLRSVFMLSQTEGWAVGTSGTEMHYSGGIWTALPINYLVTNENLNGVSFAGETGWAVGDAGVAIPIGTTPTQGVPSASFQSVYLSSSTDGWIVGCTTGGCGTGSGEPIVAHWGGNTLTRGTVAAQTADLYSVFMVNPTEGWAVGGLGTTPLILHYTGGTWTQVPTPLSGYILRSVFMVDSNDGWAVGDNGIILRYSGGSWGASQGSTGSNLRSVFMLGPNDGWAVGDGGTVLHYQSISGQWLINPSSTGARLNSIYMLDSSHGWAVGAGGIILHYDGSIWTSVSSFASANLNSVAIVSPQVAWAVGDSGTILQWTGITWNVYTASPSIVGPADLESVFVVPGGAGLIVGGTPGGGSQGTVLRVPAMNSIPEFPLMQASLLFVLMSALGLLSLRRRTPVRITVTAVFVAVGD